MDFKPVVLLAVVLLMPVFAPDADALNDAKAAVSAAEAWLILVDAGKHVDSWNAAAAYFREAVPRERWSETLTAVRTPLGRVISRQLKRAVYRTSLPGAPDGEYVVIQFATSFENKQTAVETVTPMMEADGTWRVSGYYIQ